jgi:hypothetical protein
MQLCSVNGFGLMSTILQPDPFATPSAFFDEMWISHTVKAATESGKVGWSFRICATR